MKDAIFAGLISGIISPILVSWIQHKCIWRSQKRLEYRWLIFNDAIKVLAFYARDAMDFELQQNKKEHNGRRASTELRNETKELMEKSRGLIKAFFPDSHEAFDKALRAEISLRNYNDFDEKRCIAIEKMSEELGVGAKTDFYKNLMLKFSNLFKEKH